MAGKLSFTLAQYQEAATIYRKDLLMLPIIGIQESLQYMTGRPGIRYKEEVASISGDAQFAPYKPSRSQDFNLNLDFGTRSASTCNSISDGPKRINNEDTTPGILR